MNYCLNYNATTQHVACINEADEWLIEYNPKDATLMEFLDKYSDDKRINIYFKELVDLQFLIDLSKKFDNIYFKLTLDYLPIIKKEKPDIKYFFDTEASDWDTFIGLLYKGVTDIYIVESLGFELDKAAAAAHKENVKIRVYPNIAQSSWPGLSSIKKFFIRPEDMDIYANYVDTIEFYNVDKQIDVYYKVYAKDKKWFGPLREIILDFNSDIDNKYVIPRFAEKRISCGKNCLKGGLCSRCNRISELSHSLEQSQLIVKVDKK